MFNNTMNFHFDSRGYNHDSLGSDPKKNLALQPSSLFSMAMYDVDSVAQQECSSSSRGFGSTPTFYPVEQYKDLSLKEILDISDDFLFGEEDPLMSVPTMQAVPSEPAPPAAPVPVSPTLSAPEEITATPSSSRKRSHEEVSDIGSDDEERRFRPYQAGQWCEKFDELCAYRRQTGHCLVPHTYKENLPLARWVKRQRYQYKLMMEGKSSTMTEDRVKALEDIGFIWDSQGAAWEERLGELADFRKTFHHCNVPSNFSDNPQLATWVKCQRRQYKLHVEGKPSNMTKKRISQLESLGFEWELRAYKKPRTS